MKEYVFIVEYDSDYGGCYIRAATPLYKMECSPEDDFEEAKEEAVQHLESEIARYQEILDGLQEELGTVNTATAQSLIQEYEQQKVASEKAELEKAEVEAKAAQERLERLRAQLQ